VFHGHVQSQRLFNALVVGDDLVEAFWRTVERRRVLPQEVLPILIDEPETPGYGELQREIARLLHDEPDWSTREIPKTVAKSGAWVQDKIPGIEEPFIKPWMIDLADDHYALNITRARGLLGWSPRHRLMDTLGKMIEAMREDPEGWYERQGLEAPDKVALGRDS
jgi:nucleoside-diphosphate-sugar epimerase